MYCVSMPPTKFSFSNNPECVSSSKCQSTEFYFSAVSGCDLVFLEVLTDLSPKLLTGFLDQIPVEFFFCRKVLDKDNAKYVPFIGTIIGGSC